MIKCSVTINGTISRAAQMRTDKDNNSFVSFPMSVVLPAKSGINKTVEVSVSVNGTQNDCNKYQANQRVEVQGTLTLRKRGDALYFNFMADSVNLNPVETKDKVEGEMEFRGSLGNKDVIVKNDKKGNPFSVFSGFSTEKVGENFEFIWVRFVRFSGEKEAFLQPKGKVNVKGTAEFGVYNDKVDISCRVSEISEWVKGHYQGGGQVQKNSEDECPF